MTALDSPPSVVLSAETRLAHDNFRVITDTCTSPPAPPGNRKPALWKSRGFSLVEVTLAIGLTTFSVIVLLGLLCSGVNESRQATDQTVMVQIAQQLIGMAQQTDWSHTDELSSAYFYFDETGQLLEGSEEDQAVFAGCILVEPEVNLPADGSGVNDQMAKVRVRVVRDPARKLRGAPTSELADETLRASAREFPAFLANNGA